MARPDNRRDDCPAFLKPDRKALRTLKQPGVGDVGFRVRYDSRERPVFYVWRERPQRRCSGYTSDE
jgi:hypothetical protein